VDLPPLDPVIHQPTRLRIVALLYRNRRASFTWVRDTLGLTDGNLGSHAAKLAEAAYIEEGRVLTTAGFQVWLRMTPRGDEAFGAYLEALKAYVDTESVQVPPKGDATPVTL
jgi:DNA-binding MarR family transcriptional regulator